jgi:hypothetical protein
MPFETPITVRQAVQNVLDGRYLLPSIQREFVWAPEQIETLFDSILRGYPISSFLFWVVPENQSDKWQFYRFLTKYHEANTHHNEPAQLVGGREVTAVLDGQQRLTSLVIGLTGSYAEKLPNKRRSNPAAYPIRRLHIDILNPADETDGDKRYALRFLTDAEAQNDNSRWWIALPELFQRVRNLNDLLNLMTDPRIGSAPQHQKEFASKVLSRVCECLNTESAIHYFLEREADLDKVLQIFIRINSGGTKLSYSDLLLSIATASWKGVDARQEIHELVDTLNSYSDELTVNKDFVLKSCLVLSDIGDIKFKVNNFNNVNMNLIEQKWPSIKEALNLTIQLIRSFGLSDRSLLSHNAIIPIAYYLYRKDVKKPFLTSGAYADDRRAIRRWLATVLLRGTFGSMADTILSAIRGVISESPCDLFPVGPIATRLAKLNRAVGFTEEEVDALLGIEYGDRRAFLILSLLYPDFDYSKPFHIDHAHPRTKLTERHLQQKGLNHQAAKAASDGRDTLPNLHLLQGGPNQAKSSMDFEEWLEKNHSTSASRGYFLTTHLFPDMSNFNYENIDEFFVKRRQILFDTLSSELIGTIR